MIKSGEDYGRVTIRQTIGDFLTPAEMKLRDRFIAERKRGEGSLEKQIASGTDLGKALNLCKNGVPERLFWDDKNKIIVLQKNKKNKKNKYGMGEMIHNYVKTRKMIIAFAEELGDDIGGAWIPREHRVEAIGGKSKHKYSIREYGVIWINARFKDSPAAIAIILAHEVEHALADEYRMNLSIPYDETHDNPTYPGFPIHERYDHDEWCYVFSGLLAEEMGLEMLQNPNVINWPKLRWTNEAKKWYKKVMFFVPSNSFLASLRFSSILKKRKNI